MNDYDEFAETLIDAGWSQDEIEQAWQRDIVQQDIERFAGPSIIHGGNDQ